MAIKTKGSFRIAEVAFFVVTLVLVAQASFADELEIHNQHVFRYDLLGKENDLYITRFWTEIEYDLSSLNRALRLSPFVEARHHFGLDEWYRAEFGVEVGVDLFKWLYFGESIQYVLQDQKILEREPNLPQDKNFPELETRLVATFPLKIKSFEPRLYLFEEHTFDLEVRKGTRNEVGAGLILPINRHIETSIGWRHVDRIHDYDTDYLETALSLSF